MNNNNITLLSKDYAPLKDTLSDLITFCMYSPDSFTEDILESDLEVPVEKTHQNLLNEQQVYYNMSTVVYSHIDYSICVTCTFIL